MEELNQIQENLETTKPKKKIFGQHLQENLKHLQSITIMHLKQKKMDMYK